MAKKTFNEKLHYSGDLPKIDDISGDPRAVARFGGTKLLIASPLMYNEIMARVPTGKVITADQIRAHLAERAHTDGTCPLTAGIFMNICANASAERDRDPIPYWRTLKAKGELNEKYPDGIDGQKLRLEREGHRVIQKGKKYYVKEFEESLWIIEST